MLFQPGAASASGFSVSGTGATVVGTEFLDFSCTTIIAASATLAQGQVLCYDATNVPNTAGADKLVLPTSANAARCYGVYQGPAIVNPSSTATLTVTVTVRRQGYGVVLSQVTSSSTGSTAITVGAYLIIGANGTTLPDAYAGTPAAGVTVGQALATGTHTSYGATILAASTAATLLVNAIITIG
jgi:hypothetical protein